MNWLLLLHLQCEYYIVNIHHCPVNDTIAKIISLISPNSFKAAEWPDGGIVSL